MKRSLKILISSLCYLGLFSLPVCADEIKIGVSPSFLEAEIGQGETTQIMLKVGNNSVFPEAEKESKTKLYTYDVHLTALDRIVNNKGTDEQDKALVATSWVKLGEKEFTLKPGEDRDIPITISVPKEASTGEHIVTIDVQRLPVKDPNGSKIMNFGVEVKATLQIPVFIRVKSSDGSTTALKPDYSIEEFTMSDELEQDSLFNVFKQLLFGTQPLKQRIEDFKYRPIKLEKGGKIVYDLPDVVDVNIQEALVYKQEDISNTKYILIPEGLKPETIVSMVNFVDNTLRILSGDSEYIVTLPNSAVVQTIQDQMNTLSKGLTMAPEFRYYLQRLVVPKNIKASTFKLQFNYKIKNTGGVTLVSDGHLDVLGKRNKIATSSDFSKTLILPGDTKNVMASITYDPANFEKGTYKITSILVPYTGAEPIQKENEFEIVNARLTIVLSLITGLLVIFALVVVMTIVIIKRIKRNKNNKKGSIIKPI